MYNNDNNRGSYRKPSFNKGPRSFAARGGQSFKPKRPPLPEGFALYYVAIVCPPPIEEQVQQFKDHMLSQYGCKAAAKSPAHITVVPPFRAETDMESNLLDFLSTFNIGIVPIEVQLRGYNNFGERVLYVDVAPNTALTQLEQDCMHEFGQQFPSIIFGTKPEFNPHVTIATRDIPEGKLQEAKAYFEANFPMEASFEARELKLLKLDHGHWHIV